jgi:hypothetical protein
MTKIEMRTEEARARSGDLEEILIGLRDDKYHVITALTALREKWQSHACDEFNMLLGNWIDQLGEKINNLQGLKIGLDECISAHEAVDKKLG